MEPNDTILLATPIELAGLSPIEVEISGEIGDNPDLEDNNDDVDLYEINLIAGDVVSVDIDAQVIGSDLNSFLIVFDADGEQLLRNNNTVVNGVFGSDSALEFNVLQNGTFYVGVSSSPNLNYDPNLAGSGDGNSSGIYDLRLTVEREDQEVESPESNDTILSAEVIELDSTTPVNISAEIGDNTDVDDNNDVDLYEITLTTGDTVSIDIDAQVIDSELNSVLTIFDADGGLLFQNNNTLLDDGAISLDSFLEFTAPEDGNYYVGVSSASNLNYDPNLAGSGTGESSGNYELTLTLEPEPELIEAGDTISLAEVIELDSTTPVNISGEIGDNPDVDDNNDVDLFAVELTVGDTVFADINAEITGSTLNSVLTIFGPNGDLLVQNDDNSGENFNEPDSFQQFTAPINGTYYIGVSSSENLNYDPNVADSGTGESSGVYELVLTFEETDNENPFYSEPNDDILLANSVELNTAAPVVINGEIGDNLPIGNETTVPLPNNDVDLFEVELNEGATLSINIDAQSIGSNLNSVVTVFDADGELLLQNDDNSFEDFTESDSFLNFTAPVDGTYYVGVSSSENLLYDPTVANSGVGDSSGGYRLELTLSDDLVEDLFNTPITRFQNGDRPGTFLFAGPEESQGIRDNFPNFDEEGVAFTVANQPGDDLIRFNRFQNLDVPGTYLYAGEEESISIRANFPNFDEEGIAFYTYSGASDVGEDFYRLQNLAAPGTYIFVGNEERTTILANFPEFEDEGVAFKVAI